MTVHVIDQLGVLTYHKSCELHGKHIAPQLLIKAGKWFAAEVVGANRYSLIGCTVFPAFDFNSFELAGAALAREYPQHADIISRLTRE